MDRQLDFYTDASGHETSGGMGGVFGKHWFKAQWSEDFMKQMKPSIAFLELHSLVAAVLIWRQKLSNSRATIFCNNQSVVAMVNNLTSGCKNCMFLLRILVKCGLQNNFKMFVKFIPTHQNGRADALSRDDLPRFLKLCKEMGIIPDAVSAKLLEEIWPPQRCWID